MCGYRLCWWLDQSPKQDDDRHHAIFSGVGAITWHVLTSPSLNRDSLWYRNERVVDRDKPHEWRRGCLSLHSVIEDQETPEALGLLKLAELLVEFQINRDLRLSYHRIISRDLSLPYGILLMEMRATSEPHLFPHRLYDITVRFDPVDGLGFSLLTKYVAFIGHKLLGLNNEGVHNPVVPERQ